MSLITKGRYRFAKGDLLTAKEAAEYLGISPRALYGDRLTTIEKEFAAAGVEFTTSIWIGGTRRFLRSEIDEFLSTVVEKAKAA